MVSGHCLSAALLQRRHDHAQRFLDVFSRTVSCSQDSIKEES